MQISSKKFFTGIVLSFADTILPFLLLLGCKCKNVAGALALGKGDPYLDRLL